jgi:DNA (cytosine-5)-methyltransferase 1
MESIGDLPALGLDSLFTPNETSLNHSIYPLSDDRLKAVRKTRWGQGARYFRASKTKTLPNWVRLFPNRFSTSINGLSRYVHPYENRILTVREHARLMSYPDSYTFVGAIESQYNQVGESVPPIISQLISQEVRAYLG